MEIGHRQQVGFSVLDPSFFGQCLAFGAVPVPAGVVGDADVIASITHIHMAAQSRSATGFDSMHRTEMSEVHLLSVSLSVVFSECSEDMGEFC